MTKNAFNGVLNSKNLITIFITIFVSVLLIILASLIGLPNLYSQITPKTIASSLSSSAEPTINLSFTGCNNSNNIAFSTKPSNSDLEPTCQNIAVTANTPGYSLLVKSSGTNWNFTIEKQSDTDGQNYQLNPLPTTDYNVHTASQFPASLTSFKTYYTAKPDLPVSADAHKTTIIYTAIGEDMPETPSISLFNIDATDKWRLSNRP
jgi:hypothetical protein